jgi:hypothetical protein
MADLDITVDGNLPTATTVDGLADRLFISQGGSLKDVPPSVLLNNGGWIEVSDSWSYASASTITVPSGATAKYQVGNLVRLKQGGGYKYYVITAVADTLLTVYGGSDYTVANAGISDIAYSIVSMPLGFPSFFNFSASWAAGITVGTPTQVATVQTIGRRAIVIGKFVLGAGSAVTGDVSLSLPIAAAAPPGESLSPVGFIALRDASPAGTYHGNILMNGTTGTLMRASTVSGSNIVITPLSSTVPFTWASGDGLFYKFDYLF